MHVQWRAHVCLWCLVNHLVAKAVFANLISMDGTLKQVFMSWRTPVFRNENLTKRQLAVHGDYFSIYDCETKIPSLFRCICGIFFVVFHNFHLFYAMISPRTSDDVLWVTGQETLLWSIVKCWVQKGCEIMCLLVMVWHIADWHDSVWVNFFF